MKLPCEIVVWYLVPVIKSELAKDLVDRGMTQKKVAEVIDVTQAAVSQYISKKRGGNVQLAPQMKEDIKSFVDRVINGKTKKEDIQKLICKECMLARELGLLEKLGS